MTVTRDEIEVAVGLIVAHGGPFALYSAVDQAILATGWDPANDGNPLSHVLGIAEIVDVNVDAERDLALCFWQAEMKLQRGADKTVDDYRSLANRILSHVVANAATAG